MKEYYRGNLFPNTHDILPFILQEGGRPAFKMRFALAATLSSVYGIYSGYELCENTPVPGREEYLNSEKYEYKVWDWDRPGNIIPYITRINAIRREHPALHLYDNLRFYRSDDENITAYGKATPDGCRPGASSSSTSIPSTPMRPGSICRWRSGVWNRENRSRSKISSPAKRISGTRTSTSASTRTTSRPVSTPFAPSGA